MRVRLSIALAAFVVWLIGACTTGPKPCLEVGNKYYPVTPELNLQYKGNYNTQAETDTLEARYGFTAIAVYPEFNTAVIPAPQPPSVVHGLSCEPSMFAIWYQKPDSN